MITRDWRNSYSMIISSMKNLNLVRWPTISLVTRSVDARPLNMANCFLSFFRHGKLLFKFFLDMGNWFLTLQPIIISSRSSLIITAELIWCCSEIALADIRFCFVAGKIICYHDWFIWITIFGTTIYFSQLAALFTLWSADFKATNQFVHFQDLFIVSHEV